MADGGNGGTGGSVVFLADPKVQGLPLNRKHICAENGTHGSGNKRHGRNGQNIIIRVPCGVTVKCVRNIEVEEENFDDDHDTNELYGHRLYSPADILAEDMEVKKPNVVKEVLADLDKPYSYVVAAQGGRGGLGNGSISTATLISALEPPIHDPLRRSYAHPEIGESVKIELELKIIADVGFIGFPNAGKSTLLSVLSMAKPKIAPYKFTTLRPYIGTVRYRDLFSVSCADLPGIIEGASDGRGRGITFLKHVERTRVLLYLLDSKGNPVKQLQILQQELQCYEQGYLVNRPAIVVANKVDLLHPEQKEQVLESIQYSVHELGISTNVDVIGISAAFGEGMHTLSTVVRTVVSDQIKHED